MTAQKDQDAPRRPGRPRGKKPGTANREQLMDIALTLFARDGAGRVSLNAIAKEAGVTPAMLHYYFSSRDALVTQLIEERFMPLRNHISRIFVDHPQDPVLALTMMVGAFAETADVTGEWYGELLGIQVTLTINADGTYKMDIAGMDSEEGVWEKNEDGNLVMDKGTEGEGLVTVTETGLSTEQDGMKIDFTREAPAEDEELTISTETTEEELQGKWQATSVIMNGMSVPMSMVGQECIIEVKDSNLYLLNLVGQTALAEIPIPMTFVDGILTVTLPVDENTTQMFGVAKLTDGTVLFELVQGDTTMDFLMEAVPEDAEPAAAE